MPTKASRRGAIEEEAAEMRVYAQRIRRMVDKVAFKKKKNHII